MLYVLEVVGLLLLNEVSILVLQLQLPFSDFFHYVQQRHVHIVLDLLLVLLLHLMLVRDLLRGFRLHDVEVIIEVEI